MAVNVGGHLNIRVSHVLLHVFQGKAAVEQEAGAAVAELMKADVRQAIVFSAARQNGKKHSPGKRAIPPAT